MFFGGLDAEIAWNFLTFLNKLCIVVFVCLRKLRTTIVLKVPIIPFDVK